MVRTRIINCTEYILMLLIILEFNTPYMYFPIIQKGVPVILLAMLVMLIMLKSGKVKIDFMISILMLGAVFPLLNITKGHIVHYIRLYMIFLPIAVVYLTMLFKAGLEDVKSLLLKYSNIVLIIAVVSLFFWIFGSLMEKVSFTFLIPYNWAGEETFVPSYYGLYFETQKAVATAEQTSAVIRNSGIFNEAPMYNMILCVAIGIETYIRPKLSKKRIIILFITILSTISTTGFIFLVFLFISKLYTSVSAKQRTTIILLSPIILAFAYFIISVLLENKKETGEKSYNSRSRDIVRCIEVGIENPILGSGLFHKNMSRKSENYGFSNSLFTIFAHGGLYVWALYFMALFVMPLMCYKKNKDVGILGLMLCYFILFTFTVSQYKYLTMLFMAIGLSYWNVIFLYGKKTYRKPQHLLQKELNT